MPKGHDPYGDALGHMRRRRWIRLAKKVEGDGTIRESRVLRIRSFTKKEFFGEDLKGVTAEGGEADRKREKEWHEAAVGMETFWKLFGVSIEVGSRRIRWSRMWVIYELEAFEDGFGRSGRRRRIRSG